MSAADDGARHPSWTPEAVAVLDRACDWHGQDVWRASRMIRLRPASLTGVLPRMKGAGVTFPVPRAVEVYPHECRTVFLDYPVAGQTGVFDARSTRRATFAGLAKYRRWNPLDALYFFGYALWHYHTLPFSLGAARLIRMGGGVGSDAVLHVEFAADVPTHSRRQAFHFDRTGRLLRHDYTAEIIGGWARGAHFWKQYVRVKGLAIATERHVRPRLGPVVGPGTALHAMFSAVGVD